MSDPLADLPPPPRQDGQGRVAARSDGQGPPGSGRVTPHDRDAEAAVLSALLLDSDGTSLDDVRESLTRDDFFSEAHRRIYDAILELRRAGQPSDVVTVAAFLRASDRLEQVGGAPYLAQLTDATPAIANLAAHASVVRSRAQVRALQRACLEIYEAGFTEAADAPEYLVRAEQHLAAVLGARSTSVAADTMGEALGVVLAKLSERRQAGTGLAGIPTGWRQIDWLISGWSPIPYVLAARPGMGKSGWALQATLQVARGGHIAVFASAEMPRHNVVLRALASESRVDLEKLRSGSIDDAEWSRVTSAAATLSRLPWLVIDAKGLTVPEIESVVRRKARLLQQRDPSLGLGLVALDYVQLLRGKRERGESREREVASIMAAVMEATGERRLNCAVLALSQLNRELEKRPDKRPQLSDLRESGAIEQDADTVLALYRDDAYHKNSVDTGIVEVICLKQRDGRRTTVRQRVRPELQRFDDAASERDEQIARQADEHWSETGGATEMGPPLFEGDF